MVKWWKQWVTRLWLTNHIAKSRRTVKDISGQSSHTLVRGGRPVTVNSHAAPLTLWSHRKALCSCYFLFHPVAVSLFPNSLSFVFVILSSRSVLLVEARQRDTGSADRRGQVAVCCWGCWSDGEASLACRCHKSLRCPKHTSIHPKPHRSCQHAKMSINTGTSKRLPNSFLFSLSLCLAFFIQFAAHLSF